MGDSRSSRTLCMAAVIFLLGVMVTGVSGAGWAGAFRYPDCGGGKAFFQDFAKCDASVEYCFEYRNSSCVGPPNWACVDPLNRAADIFDDNGDNSYLKRGGLGNTRCCDGSFQSPVNIPTDAIPLCAGLPTPRYANPYLQTRGIFENNGVSPYYKLEAAKYTTPLLLTNVPFTCAVPGSNNYVFSGMHIRTGAKGKKRGSEHVVGGKAYDGETSEGEYNAELNKLLTRENLLKLEESDKDCDDVCDEDESGESSEDDDSDNNDSDSSESKDSDDSSDSSDSSDDDDNDHCDDSNDSDDDNKDSDSSDDDDSSESDDTDESSEDDDNDKKVDKKRAKCFCRRRKNTDSALGYAKKGEEYFCKLRYKYGVPMNNANGNNNNNNNNNNNEQRKCSFYGNGPACGDDAIINLPLRPARLLPSKKEFFQYFGSLTSPPCSEVVNWMVYKTPIRITKQQLALIGEMETSHDDDDDKDNDRDDDGRIRDYGNVRPLQPLNGRLVSTNAC